MPVQLDGLKSALNPVVYGDIALSIKAHPFWQMSPYRFSEEVSKRIPNSLKQFMKQNGTTSITCEKHGHSGLHHTVLIFAESFFTFLKKVFPKSI